MDPDQLRQLSLQDAQEAFNVCLKSLQRSADLRIPMLLHARVSSAFPLSSLLSGIDRSLVRPGHGEDMSELVEITRILSRSESNATPGCCGR